MFPNAACQWIPVALSADVPAATVVPAWVPGLELALWRSASGQLAASNNRCPHRGCACRTALYVVKTWPVSIMVGALGLKALASVFPPTPT